jgi:hypothetical protein
LGWAPRRGLYDEPLLGATSEVLIRAHPPRFGVSAPTTFTSARDYRLRLCIDSHRPETQSRGSSQAHATHSDQATTLPTDRYSPPASTADPREGSRVATSARSFHRTISRARAQIADELRVQQTTHVRRGLDVLRIWFVGQSEHFLELSYSSLGAGRRRQTEGSDHNWVACDQEENETDRQSYSIHSQHAERISLKRE